MRNREVDDLKAVDFSGGVRGKHAGKYRRGHSVKIARPDGSLTVRKFLPDKNAVVLDEDVRAYFQNAKAVNKALRALIDIIPPRRKRSAAAD